MMKKVDRKNVFIFVFAIAHHSWVSVDSRVCDEKCRSANMIFFLPAISVLMDDVHCGWMMIAAGR